MKHLFVQYQIALMAKEKGFNEVCIARYDMEYLQRTQECNNSNVKLAAPLYQQLIDWFSNKYNIEIELSRDNCGHFKITINQWYDSFNDKSPSAPEDDISMYIEKYIEYTEQTDRYESLNIAFKEAFKLI